jgi:hypothetical protein
MFSHNALTIAYGFYFTSIISSIHRFHKDLIPALVV